MRSLIIVAGLSILPAVVRAAPPAEKRTVRQATKSAEQRRAAGAVPRPASTKKKRRAPARPRCRDVFCTAQVLRLDGSSAEVRGLTEEQVEEVMQSQRARLEPCLIEARRRDPNRKAARVEFVVTGAGKVLAVRVDGKRGSPLARCIGKQMTVIRFPTTSRPRMVAAVTLAVPE